MNSDHRLETLTQEDIISFKHDIKIAGFKELERAEHFRLFPQDPLDNPSRWEYLSSYPSVECVVSPDSEVEDDHYTHISLHFKLYLLRPFSRVSWSVVVSILNGDGNPKFFRTLEDKETFINDTNQDEAYRIPVPVLYCPLFVRRDLLLYDEKENLPGGALTIRCEMEIRYLLEEPEILKWALSKRHLMFDTDKVSGYSCCLNLNSSIYPSLCKQSDYFKVIHELFASEGSWHYISDNLVAFADMLYFVENKTLDHVTNSSSLIRLYKLAYKYAVRKLIKLCRSLMISNMTPDFAAKTLIEAYKHFDKKLRDKCFKYIYMCSIHERLCIKREIEAANGSCIIEAANGSSVISELFSSQVSLECEL